MARQIRWAEEAASDLAAIVEYIAEDAPGAARRFARRATAAARSLAELPQRGRPVPELQPLDLREIFLGDYRIIYRFDHGVVSIAAVIHGARDLAALWDREGRSDR